MNIELEKKVTHSKNQTNKSYLKKIYSWMSALVRLFRIFVDNWRVKNNRQKYEWLQS